MSTKFSQFTLATMVYTSDITVGLRNGVNYQFPMIGVGDSAGDAILTYGVQGSVNVTFDGTGSIVVPVGTTAQQPTPLAGAFRYNTTTGFLEYGDGAVWTDIVSASVFNFVANLPLSVSVVANTATFSIVNPLTVQYGGTGVASVGAYMPLVGGVSSTGALQSVLNNGQTGWALTYVSSSAVPQWAPGSSTVQTITQAANGFAVGQVLYLNSTTYALAEANSTVTAEVVGVVSQIIDANTFVLTTVGYITGLSGLTAGAVYWLSDATPGLATTTIPTTVGNVTKPVWIAASATTAYIYQERGKIIPSPQAPGFQFNSATTNTALVTTNGYITNGVGSALTYTVPASPTVGDYYIVGGGTDTFGWVIQMNTGQTLHLGSTATTVAGTVTSANQYDAVAFYCASSSTFVAYDIVGNPVCA